MEIEIINYGIACRVGNKILVNKHLFKNRPLANAIIKHEMGHSKFFSIKDIFHDLRIKNIDGLRNDYYRFIITHPSSWTEFLPFWRHKGKLFVNVTLLGFYGIVLAIMGGIGWILIL